MPLGKTESSVHAAPNENPGGSISGVFVWLVVIFTIGGPLSVAGLGMTTHLL